MIGYPVQIRRMSASDLERVLELAGSLPEAPHWPGLAYKEAMDTASPRRRIALVATAGETNKLVGFLVAGLLAPEAELESIAVAAAVQRQGIGKLLLLGLFEQLQGERIDLVHLEVRASNSPALGFYRSLGFTESGRRSRYYTDPVDDAVLMALDLR